MQALQFTRANWILVALGLISFLCVFFYRKAREAKHWSNLPLPPGPKGIHSTALPFPQ